MVAPTPGMSPDAGIPDDMSIYPPPDFVALRQSLASALGLRPDALPENRAGRLAASQTPALRSLGRQHKLKALLFAAAGVALIAFGLSGWPERGTDVLATILGLVFGLILLRLAWSTWTSTALGDAIASGAVEQIQGFVRPVVVQAQRSQSNPTETTDYFYDVEGRRFKVSEAAFHAIVAGLRYRIFYLPTTDEYPPIVNIEPIEPAALSTARTEGPKPLSAAIVGRWRAVSLSARQFGQQVDAPLEAMEFEFRADGTLIEGPSTGLHPERISRYWFMDEHHFRTDDENDGEIEAEIQGERLVLSLPFGTRVELERISAR